MSETQTMRRPKLNIVRHKLPRLQRLHWFMLLLFALGVLGGAVLISNCGGTLTSYVQYITRYDVQHRAELPVWAGFALGILPLLMQECLCLLLSYSAFGTPLLLFGIAARGLALGCCAGYLYGYCAGKGILYNVLLIAPVGLAGTLFLVDLCAAGLYVSSAIYMNVFRGAQREMTKLKSGVSAAALRMLVCAFLCAAYETLIIKLAADLIV